MARHGRPVDLGADALAAMAESREVVDRLADDVAPHYGISTGFGALATTSIPPHRRAALQTSLIRSHAAGSGEPVEREVVRALMLLRLATLARGRTGIRPATAAALAEMLSAGITPIVPEYGSLGCSGDLAPLAAVALALIGEGDVIDQRGRRRPAADALAEAGLTPVVLAEKEGLALINGTDGMLGMLVMAIDDLQMLLDAADLAAAMSVEALMGTDRVFAADLQTLRPQAGQAVSAARILAALAGSEIVASHAGDKDTRVQDAYSLRCSPAVHGAARDTLAHASVIADRELASSIDNPVVLPDGRVQSNGNFHGAPIAAVLDFLAISVADVAGICERRTDRMLDASRSQGLPPFLAHEVGRRLRAHDRPVHPGRHRLGAEAAGRSGLGRFDPVVGDAGGPRVDGLARRTQTAALGRRSPAGHRHRDPHCGKSAGFPCAADARPGHRARSGPSCGPGWPGRGPTAISAPRSTPSSTCSPMDRPWPQHSNFATPTSRMPTAFPTGRTEMTTALPSTAGTPAGPGPRPVRAARGTTLTAKSWSTEAPLRMLCNNLDPEVAEEPDKLVVYGGTGKAARNWASFDAICRTLTDLEQDETLLVQSGKPVGVLRTHEWAPRVLIANSNLVGDWATWPEFRRLEALGLTMYGQMTAGSWIYIGSQGIVQGTYETFSAVAEKLAAGRGEPGSSAARAWPGP